MQELRQENQCTNVMEFYHYLCNRISVIFQSTRGGGGQSEFTLDLSQNMSYMNVVSILGNYIQCDPKNILLFIPDMYNLPSKPYLLRLQSSTLSDILTCIPYHNNNNNCYKLYYDVLSISLTEYKSRKLIKLNVCYPTSSDLQYFEFVLPKNATILDLENEINMVGSMRIFQVNYGQVYKVFKPTDLLGTIIDEEGDLFAEVMMDNININI
jgi:ubiquitin carboxyl-terminal hydrolase 7